MSSIQKPHLHLEVGHILFLDIVGYSKLLADEQKELIQELNQIVRETGQFRAAEAEGKLTRLPTGDGMVLVFTNNPEAPVECALEISKALQSHPTLKLRMGIHSGPVNPFADVNLQSNLAGAGINVAQRVMSCGDAGHILLSKHFAEDLEHYAHWRSYLHDVGTLAAKHRTRIPIVNLYTDQLGNSALPAKLRQARAAFRFKSAVVALLLIAVLGIGLWMLRRSQAEFINTAAVIPKKSIAVLPFENLSADPENAFFTDGVQDEILNDLAKIADLKVISRTSVMQYKSGVKRNLRQIANELGVAHVLEGSVQRVVNRVRVSAQLIDARTDTHLWVERYDRPLDDVFAIQSEIAKAIAGQLQAKLSPGEKSAIEQPPTNNPAAYEAYLRARVFAARLGQKSYAERAIQFYQEAVKLDRSFALAWARLSSAQSASYWQGFDPSPAQLAAARDAADHALALDPNLPETRLALGYYRYYGQHDFTGGLAEFEQAKQAFPNNVDVIEAIAFVQRRLAHWEEAIGAFRRVVELDPRYDEAYNNLAATYKMLHRFPEALATVDRVLAWDPANPHALFLKVNCLWDIGNLQAVESLLANPGIDPELRGVHALFQRRYAAAIEIFSSVLAANSKDGLPSETALLLGLSQQRAGDGTAARATYQKAAQDFQRELEKVVKDSLHEAWLRSGLGLAHAGLGEAVSATAEGQKAMALDSTSKNPIDGPTREAFMAEIYAVLGDADHGIPILKRLLQIPGAYSTTPALLRLHPVWDQIRNDPAFQKLCEEKQP